MHFSRSFLMGFHIVTPLGHEKKCRWKGAFSRKNRVHPEDDPVEGNVDILLFIWFKFNNCSLFSVPHVREKYKAHLCHPLLLCSFAIFYPPSRMAHPYLWTLHPQTLWPLVHIEQSFLKNPGSQQAMYWQLFCVFLVPPEAPLEEPTQVIRPVGQVRPPLFTL